MGEFDLYQLIEALSISIDIAESTMSNDKVFDKQNFYDAPSLSQHKFFNHSKRTCYVSLTLAQSISKDKKFLEEIYIASMLHDIGVCSQLKKSHEDFDFVKKHTERGYTLMSKLPFSKSVFDAVKYHHENYNGTGPNHLKGDEIPIEAQIIRLADIFEVLYDYEKPNFTQRGKILKWVTSNENILFSPELVKIFLDVQSKDFFWWDYEMIGFSSYIFDNIIPNKKYPITINELKSIALVFADIIDNKSNFTFKHSQNLAKLVGTVSDYLEYDYEKKTRLEIAALLHDIGKLAVPEAILNKNNSLTDMEFSVIKSHAYYTRIILGKIKGLEDIIDIASNHHEKLDGTGYPLGLSSDDISFESRMMAICDIYDALTSKRPYKDTMSTDETFKILDRMAEEGKVCAKALKIFEHCVKTTT
ncbi:HD-GYP domain-containing protein [Clostridium cylindrosporum]|uniref:HDIG domain-containing protein n=1 Tax=Clostridium cylindrosporum DSM 605 TaxID=1121307 RepID=A0A0J8DBW3_CLOCY|nr:HD domain-containing phosphohydrolase [Clostridium cylindrosporum]KMT23357.1 HDIG domain-containing protein [Clostridium cylindrosporum DSM 605]